MSLAVTYYTAHNDCVLHVLKKISHKMNANGNLKDYSGFIQRGSAFRLTIIYFETKISNEISGSSFVFYLLMVGKRQDLTS